MEPASCLLFLFLFPGPAMKIFLLSIVSHLADTMLTLGGLGDWVFVLSNGLHTLCLPSPRLRFLAFGRGHTPVWQESEVTESVCADIVAKKNNANFFPCICFVLCGPQLASFLTQTACACLVLLCVKWRTVEHHKNGAKKSLLSSLGDHMRNEYKKQ